MRSKIRISISVMLIASAGGFPAAELLVDHIDVTMTPGIRKYCHIVRFPQGWKIPRVDAHGHLIGFSQCYSKHEFRMEGVLSSWFLVGAFTADVGGRYDTTNRYRVNLSDPTAPIRSASSADWNAATVLPLIQKSVFVTELPDNEEPVFNGFRFTKSGARWPPSSGASRLSPDSAWLVLQSETSMGMSKSGFLYLYKIFFDVFNADTGKKVATIDARYSGLSDDQGDCFAYTGWLTERYFIVPLGERLERCLVCEFGHVTNQSIGRSRE